MKLRLLLLIVPFLANWAIAQNTITVTDADLGTDEYNWTSDNE